LQRLQLSRLDLFFLHSNVVPDRNHMAPASWMTLYQTFVDHVRPVFERSVDEGMIGAWGLTGLATQTLLSSSSDSAQHRPPLIRAWRIRKYDRNLVATLPREQRRGSEAVHGGAQHALRREGDR